jgi:DNA repair exonuclease SbcCD ATPase subunit
MGQHYVPQEYLRGFAEPDNPDAIWMYDKKWRKFTNPSIKSIAQESAFYSAEIERQLNDLVERPANLVLDKLRCREEINDQERVSLAIYIATMIKRVPKRRTKALAMFPAVYEKTMKEIRSVVEDWARVSQDKVLVERRMAELAKAEQTYQNEPPEEIREQIRIPWPTEQMISLVYSMSWCAFR